MDIPCFDELSSEASNHRPTSEAPPVAEAESVAAPRAQPPIQRDPPPPLPDTRASGGDELEEGPVDFRGARRAVGKVVTLGEVVVRPEKKKPYQIYAITLKDGNGDEQQFRGYELAQHVENNMVRLGDTISLKRGRQQFWVTRAGSARESSATSMTFKLSTEHVDSRFGRSTGGTGAASAARFD